MGNEEKYTGKALPGRLVIIVDNLSIRLGNQQTFNKLSHSVRISAPRAGPVLPSK